MDKTAPAAAVAAVVVAVVAEVIVIPVANLEERGRLSPTNSWLG